MDCENMEGRDLKKKLAGFTLIEVLISFVVIAAVAAAILSAYVATFKSINLALAKSTAVSIANGRIESIRNMAYTDVNFVGTLDGKVTPSEEITQNGVALTVETKINFVDDAYDGVGALDDISEDYKKVEVVVWKTGRPQSVLARLVTNVVSNAAETIGDTGILYICVIDSTHQPVEGATVTVDNEGVSYAPADFLTGVDGCVIIPNLPEDNSNDYHIRVTYAGYSTDVTYPIVSGNPKRPRQPDENIYTQEVTTLSLSIDQLAAMTLRFMDQGGNLVPDLRFWLQGSKIAYSNDNGNNVTYKCSEEIVDWGGPNAQDPYIESSVCASEQNSGTGEVVFSDIEFDDYKIIIKPAISRYVLSTDPMQAFTVPAGSATTVNVTVSDNGSLPRIYNSSPRTGAAGTAALMLTVRGKNFSGSTITLINQADPAITIPPTGGVSVSNDPDDSQFKLLEATFNLTGAATGMWKYQVQNAVGETVQNNALMIE